MKSVAKKAARSPEKFASRKPYIPRSQRSGGCPRCGRGTATVTVSPNSLHFPPVQSITFAYCSDHKAAWRSGISFGPTGPDEPVPHAYAYDLAVQREPILAGCELVQPLVHDRTKHPLQVARESGGMSEHEFLEALGIQASTENITILHRVERFCLQSFAPEMAPIWIAMLRLDGGSQVLRDTADFQHDAPEAEEPF